MKHWRIAAALATALLSTSALAADNAVIVTPGSGVTLRSIDVGAGLQAVAHILVSTAGAAIYGTAGTANANVLTVQGVASMTKLLVTPDSVALPANQSVNLAQVAGVSTPVGSGVQATAPRFTLATDSPGILTLGQATMANSAPVTLASNQSTISVIETSQYPTGAVPITASTTGTTAATTATLAASASIKTYICGFSIRANATAAATGNSTVTGTITGTLNFTQWTAPLASGLGKTEERFVPCVPSSAINTGIAVISAAPGSGGVVSVAAWGYQL